MTLAFLLPMSLAAQSDVSRAETEQRLETLKTEIIQLQKSLEKDRATLGREQTALKTLDLDIQQNTRRMRDLESRRKQHELELENHQAEQKAWLGQLRKSHARLEQQVLAAWQVGRESRLKLVLNQDSPARSNRLLAYYDYFSRAQAGKIHGLKEALAGLDAILAKINGELEQLAAITQQYENVESGLQLQRSERLELLSSLEASIGGGEQKLAELNRNRQDLEKLLQTLSNALADIPTDLGEHSHPTTQRGRLPMPVKGRVLHAFGQSRGAGLSWQGWLVEAREGTEIRSIAYGRVAYADWLRGYGLLIIIDHGEGFMSLYGNNESLLSGVGDWVQPGAAIATLGSNPGTGQGLYFELRNKGKAVDPAAWVSRK